MSQVIAYIQTLVTLTLQLRQLVLLLPLLCVQLAVSQTGGKGSPLQVSSYLDSIYTILHEHALHRSTVDWDSVRAVLGREIGHAQTPSDCYPAIRRALRILDDHHSFLLTPFERAHLDSARYSRQRHPESHLFKGKVGLLTVPAFASRDTIEQRLYAADVRSHLTRLRASGANKWIIDLRANMGGNMWPMLDGLSSLLSADTVGYSVFPDGQKEPWRSHAERAPTLQAIEPIAVLIGPWTGSSGEAIAVAFKCRPCTRFFGLPSGGLTTANKDFSLPDSALLLVTDSFFADRCGVSYSAGVVPDEQIGSEAWSDTTAVVTARRWLAKQATR